MELGREHPDPGHPSSFALDLEEGEAEEEEDEEEVEQNSDVMGVMNMEEKVGGHLGSGSEICSTQQLAPTSSLPATHSPSWSSLHTNTSISGYLDGCRDGYGGLNENNVARVSFKR